MKMVYMFLFCLIMPQLASLLVAYPEYIATSKRCKRTKNGVSAEGQVPPLCSTYVLVVMLVFALAFWIRYEPGEIPPWYCFLFLIALKPVAYLLLYAEQHLWMRYPRLTIENETLRLKSLFSEREISFEELRKGARLMRPFIYNFKVYMKLEQGSIVIAPLSYIGGFDFLKCLFEELGWDPAWLRKKEHLYSPFMMRPPKVEYSGEIKALYEMLEKEQEELKEKCGKMRPKPPGLWSRRD